MNEPVDFASAKVGDDVFTYRNADGEPIWGEFGWVTDLEFFDERYEEIRLVRSRWRLIEQDEMVLPDPYPCPDDELVDIEAVQE